MSKAIMESVTFVSNLGDITERGIPSVDGGLGVRPFTPKQLLSTEIEAALMEAVASIGRYLDRVAQDQPASAFLLDEVELTVQATQSGKVSVFLADVGGAVQGGIKLKWKRRPGQAGGEKVA